MISTLSLLVLATPIALATSAPTRGVKITTPFPRVSIDAGSSLKQKVTIKNIGDREEVINLSVTRPSDDWVVFLRDGGYEIRSVYLPPGEEQTVDMAVYPPSMAKSGSYIIELRAISTDNSVETFLSIIVDIESAFEREIDIYCPSRTIEGPSSKDFEFIIEVVNRGKAKIINYNIFYPAGWEANVLHEYTDTVLRSQSFKDGETQVIRIKVDPPSGTKADEYPIIFVASSGDTHTEMTNTLVITGTYKISIATKTGKLSIDATCGKETSLTVVVTNEGTGIIKDIRISTPGDPTGWNVTFDPDTIPSINPGESRETNLTIKPASDALPGDYALQVGAYAGSPYYRSDTFDLRVSVSTATAWGYIGVGLLGVILVGLFLAFWRLGRR